MRRRLARLGVGALLVAGAMAVTAPAASAHPLGNFTVNTHSGLRVDEERISVEFLVDMAEVPTLQRKADVDLDGNGTTTASERTRYAERECPRLSQRLELRVDDRLVDLRSRSSTVAFPPGQAGLSTLRLTCALEAAVGPAPGERRVSFANRNYTDRAGWREVTAAGDGASVVASDVPGRSISRRLTRYPDDLLASPLDRTTAALVVRPGGPAAGADDERPEDGAPTPLPRGVDGATQAFTSFVARQNLTVGFAVVALLASLVLGALHALAPGHGKTVMAAYLVGQRGSLRHAVAIALTVTATHTGGVLALGIAISASAVVAPERLYPWLGAASGVLLALIGVSLLARNVRLRRRERTAAHTHHAHTDDSLHHEDGGAVHSHGGVPHRHGPGGSEELMTWRGLLTMGFVGGLVPSPSAVVVLLGAMALGRTWFGVVLVLAYGLGMAATLTTLGLVLLRAREALDRRRRAGRQHRLLGATSRMLPSATAGLIVVAGLYLATRGAAQI
ncbi:MAG: nickel transporter [Actinomycetota bacterium]|nr:nickel transporter [Actinomycetota bacterium]